MDTRVWFRQPLFYTAVVQYTILTYVTLAWGPWWAAILYPEDHFFENLGVLSLFLAAGIALYTFLKAFTSRKLIRYGTIKLLALLALAAWFFFMAGEEISWGQRILHIAEPAALGAINDQNELNLHNIAVLQHNPFLNFDHIFSFFWLSYTVLLPLLARKSSVLHAFIERYVPLVGLDIGVLFAFNYLLAQLGKAVFERFYTYPLVPFVQALMQVKQGIAEPLCALIALTLLWQLRLTISQEQLAAGRSSRLQPRSAPSQVQPGPAHPE
jgi:hypothetical protein